MNITVTKTEYFNAIDRALDIACAIPEHPRSHRDAATAAFVAWVYDSTLVQESAGEDLLVLLANCDLIVQDLLLSLLVGRLSYGRPSDHPRRVELENYYSSFVRRSRI